MHRWPDRFGRTFLLFLGLGLACVVTSAPDVLAQSGGRSAQRSIVPVTTRQGSAPIDVTERPQELPVVEVRVEGHTTILENAIRRYLRAQPGRPLSYSQIQEDVAALLNTRWFLSVSHSVSQTEQGPVITYHVVEAPILQSVQYEGNRKIRTRELEAHTGLRPGHGFDPMLNRQAAERIRQLYLNRGYRHVQVELVRGGTSSDRDVLIRIDEGPKVRLWWVSFDGNEFVSDGVLRTKIASRSVILWVIGGEYDPLAIQADVRALVQYYQSLGFFDVEVVPEEQVSDNGAWVSVVFRIREGTRFRVRNIEMVGNNILDREQLLPKPTLNPGDFFNARFLRTDVNGMKEQYGELGRLFATVQPTPRFLEESGWIDLEYRIDEDRPYYFGQIDIHIRGENPHTQEFVVRNQVNPFLKPGHLATSSDLRMAQARVMGSHLWEPSDPPRFDVRPVDGSDYLPPLSLVRGQQAGHDSMDGFFEHTSPSRGQTTLALFDDPLRYVTEQTADPLIEQVLDQHRSAGFGHSLLPTLPPELSPPIHIMGNVTCAAPADEVEARSETARSTLGIVPDSPAAMVPLVASSAWSTLPEQWAGSTPGSQTASRASAYQIDPTPFINALDDEGFVFRGQSPIYRSQSIDGYGQPIPQNPIFNVSPQGDPYGDAMRQTFEPGFVDVGIDVTEGRTGRLMFGVGVNSDAGVVGSLIFQEDNFDILRPPQTWADVIQGRAWRGGGQSFRIEAVPGSDVSRYLVSWTDPFFMYTDFSLGISGFYFNRFYHDWTEDRLGGRISIGRLLNRYWSLGAAIRLENVDIRNFRTPAPADLASVKGDNFLSTGSVTLSYDSRDSVFIPTQGSLLEGTYEQAFGEFTYPRFEITGSQYWTLYERPDGFGKHTFNLRGQVGWTGSNTPIFERFYAGGYSSFRGFAFRGVTPREMGVRVGGDFQFLGTAEYMIPVTASDNVRAVFFSDFGTVETKASFDHFRVTAGVGARLVIPAMGPAPLAFDFAFPIVDEPEDNRRLFSFYIGLTR